MNWSEIKISRKQFDKKKSSKSQPHDITHKLTKKDAEQSNSRDKKAGRMCRLFSVSSL